MDEKPLVHKVEQIDFKSIGVGKEPVNWILKMSS